MAEYLIQSETLTSIADAIRTKTGGTGTLSPSQMASEIEGISASGENHDMEDALIVKTVSGDYRNDRVTSIGTYAFGYCSSLVSVDFPVVTSISNQAFYMCRSLTNISFPMAKSIGTQAFGYCSVLASIDFPAATYIGNVAFGSCSKLTSVNLPVATSISNGAFAGCSALTSINLPAAKIIGSSAFSSCRNLSTASFPALQTISSTSTFYNCYNLSQIYLTGSSLCTLSNSNAFTNTPYAGYSSSFSGTPYIYVPASLVDTYKTANNWSYFSNYFSACDE